MRNIKVVDTILPDKFISFQEQIESLTEECEQKLSTLVIRVKGVINSFGDEIGDSLLIENGKVTKIGYNLQVGYGKIIELDSYIMPGIVDSHLHLTWLGLYLKGADLSTARTSNDIAVLMSKTTTPIAYGRGWDQEKMNGIYPDKKPLDKLVSDRPAIALRVCGHVALVNSVTLQITRPWEKYPELVDKDKGLIWEDAVGYVLNKLLESVDLSSFITYAVKTLRNHGVVAVSSMSCLPKEAETLSNLDGNNQLKIKVACYPDYERLEEALGKAGLSGRNWKIAGVKLFSDGSLGAHTARLSQPYYDDPRNRGLLLLDSSRIKRIASEALNREFRVATHAIGDEALGHVLDAYDELSCGEMCRVEHASLATNYQISRMRELGIFVIGQPRFRVGDWWLDKRLGMDRVYELAYRYNTMLKEGVKLALSTDSPVEPFNPVETIKASMGYCPDTPACRVKHENMDDKGVLYTYTLSGWEASFGQSSLSSDMVGLDIWDLAVVSVYPFSENIDSLTLKGLAEVLENMEP